MQQAIYLAWDIVDSLTQFAILYMLCRIMYVLIKIYKK